MSCPIVLLDDIEPDPVITICTCGHPVIDHLTEIGCQSAKSYRSESYGGGVGSSYCQCAAPVQIARVPRKHVNRFRRSPTKQHALSGGVGSMQKAGIVDEIEWDLSMLVCAAAAAGRCVEGPVKPLYTDSQGTRTQFFCFKHADIAESSGLGFDHVKRIRSQKHKRERLENLKRALEHDDDEKLRARGLAE